MSRLAFAILSLLFVLSSVGQAQTSQTDEKLKRRSPGFPTPIPTATAS